MTMAISRLMLASTALMAPTILVANANAATNQEQTPDEQSGTPPASTSASPANSGLADIVVTAQKRSENLQNVPIAIASVAPETIEKAGIQSTQGLAAVLPGAQFLNTGGNLIPRVRGIGSSFTAAGLESSVATYIDGVYRSFSADIEVDYTDVAQLALLKGPQGTLFGRNATGGVLQITTRQPSFDFGGSFQSSLDNYLTSRSNLFVTGGLSDKVAASVSLSYATQGKGYGKNFTTGNDNYKLNHSISGNAKLKAELGDRTTINLAGDYRDSGGPQALGVRTAQGFGTIFPVPERGDAWDSNSFFDPSIKFHGGGGSVKLDQDFDFATLTLISSYRNTFNEFKFTTTTVPTKANYYISAQRNKQFTQEIQLVSPSDGRFNWTVGAFYYWNKANVDLLLNFYNPAANDVISSTNPVTEQQTNSVAAFAQGTFKATDSTRITGGIRYTYDHIKFDGSAATVFLDTLPPFLPPFLAGQTVVTAQSETQTVKKPSWRIAVDHDLADRMMVYASWNRGVKSGAFNTTAVGVPAILPERLDAYEGGLKSVLLDNRLRVNLGGFYYDYRKPQVLVYTSGSPSVRNAGSVELYGADLDAEAQLSPELKLTGSVNWLHARFQQFDDAPIGIPNPGLAGASFPPGLSAAGNTVPYSPKVTYAIGVDYRIDTQVGPVGFNINDNYNSGFFTESDNVLRQKSYHFINASVRWTSPDSALSVRVFAENILNEAVVSLLATTTTSYNRDTTNPPFRIGAGIKLDF